MAFKYQIYQSYDLEFGILLVFLGEDQVDIQKINSLSHELIAIITQGDQYKSNYSSEKSEAVVKRPSFQVGMK